MVAKDVFSRLPAALLPWYCANKRELPWRGVKDPYYIWISEIMLQQTRVEAVKGYYERFVTRLPTVKHLADVEYEILYKLWEGLGYYTRARNLKKAAEKILSQHQGVFPKSYEDVIALPGVGEYTAGAICSIAYNMPTPAVDGNVLRVAARLLNDHSPVDTASFRRYIHQMLSEVYPSDAGIFTQALMELGATVCGPNRKAQCGACPCNSFCLSYAMGTADDLPVRLPKRNKRIEERTVFVLECNGAIALEKREEKGLLAGMWQFPNVLGKLNEQAALDLLESTGVCVREIEKTVEREHIFTHIKWVMRGVYVAVKERNDKFSWFTVEQLENETALPTAFKQFCEKREVDKNE